MKHCDRNALGFSTLRSYLEKTDIRSTSVTAFIVLAISFGLKAILYMNLTKNSLKFSSLVISICSRESRRVASFSLGNPMMTPVFTLALLFL